MTRETEQEFLCALLLSAQSALMEVRCACNPQVDLGRFDVALCPKCSFNQVAQDYMRWRAITSRIELARTSPIDTVLK